MQLNLLEITGSDVVCTTRAVCVNETPIFSAPAERGEIIGKKVNSILYHATRNETHFCIPKRGDL